MTPDYLSLRDFLALRLIKWNGGLLGRGLERIAGSWNWIESVKLPFIIHCKHPLLYFPGFLSLHQLDDVE
jgi:hypothetical protein